jgi:toxin HigB-1
MIRSFRSDGLEKLFNSGKVLENKTLIAQTILDMLDVIDLAGEPRDAAFVGFRFDEWTENGEQRYGIMISDHWLISYGWSDGHAIDLDLERLD